MEKDIDLIIWDLETSGFVAPKDKVLEIGCAVVIGEVCEYKHWVLNNEIEIPEKITEITGITKAIIDAEGKDPKACLIEFLPLFKRCKKNVTHNGVRFDIPFITDYAVDVMGWSGEQRATVLALIESTAFDTAVHFKSGKLGMKQRDDEHFISFANRVMNARVGGVKFNLGLCCDEIGVDRSNVVQHRALADVSLTHELYKLINK